MTKEGIKKLADRLYQAEKDRRPIKKFSDKINDMTKADAYAVQLETMRRKLEEDGEKLIGMKIGLTSKGMQQLVGVDTPDYGHLTDAMLVLEGQSIDTGELIAPKVEGEIAFILKNDLVGPVVTIADVYNATDYVVPAIEIVDSRVENWNIGYFDTVADNGSSAKFIAGSGVRPIADIDMRLTGMNIEKNGELIASGTVAEVWGNPAASVAWLANSIAEYGIKLTAGQIVLAGALTAAETAVKGDVFTVTFGAGLGAVSAKFE